MLFSNTFENTRRILVGLQFSFKSFLPFRCKGVTSDIFKPDGNENDLKKLLTFVDKKLANMSKFPLATLMGMPKCWEV